MPTLARLRERALREGGEGALESFSAAEGQGAPDADGLIAAIPAMSLMVSRRYLLADRVERWTPKQVGAVAAALAQLPPETTVVLAAREEPPKVKAPKKLAEAVEKAGGEVLAFDAPAARALPRWLGEEARRRGFELEPDAARLLIERMGTGTVRLANELDRLALWAGRRGLGHRRRPRADDRRHLRGDGLEPLRRDRRATLRARPCATPTASPRRARACRRSSTASRAACARRIRPRPSSRRAARRARSRPACG